MASLFPANTPPAFYPVKEMDSVYENFYMPSATASDDNYSEYRGNCTAERERERKREVTSPKWTKVLLTLLGFSLVFAVGGLCALGVIYVKTHADIKSAPEMNSTIMRELEEYKTSYTRVKELLSLYTAQSCNHSVDSWIAHRGKLYFFSSDKLNWSSSRDDCVSKGADLVTITSQSEQGFLVSKIEVTHWIGLNDLDTEGRWVWVNNQTLKETGVEFWFSARQREPDNWRGQDPSGENCASLGDANGNFQSWFDASCRKKKKFICEKNC